MAANQQRPPDGGWGWVVVAGSALSHFLLVGLGRSFGLFYTSIKDNFQTTAAEAAWTVSIYNTIRMFGGPPAGILSDRFTCRLVVFIGGLIAAVGCVLASVAPSLVVIYLTFGLITGIGGALCFAPSYIIVGKYFDKKKGKAMSLATLGSGLGGVALAPIISLCLTQYGYFGAVLIIGGLMLNNCVAAGLYRPISTKQHKVDESNIGKEMDTITEKEHETPETLHYQTAENGSQIIIDELEPENIVAKESTVHEQMVAAQSNSCCDKVKTFIRKNFPVVTNPRFLLYFSQIATMAICIQNVLTFLPDLGILRGFGNNLSALLLSIVGGSDMLGRFVIGFIFDIKLFRTRRRLLHSILGITFGSIALLFAVCQTYVHFVITCVAWGVIEGGYHSQRATVVSEFTSKDEASSAIAFTIAAQGIGNLIGPPVAGWLKDISGDYKYSYIFSGAPLVIMASLFVLEYFYSQAKENRKRKQGPQQNVSAV